MWRSILCYIFFFYFSSICFLHRSFCSYCSLVDLSGQLFLALYLHSPICIQHFVFFFLPPEKVCLTILTVIFSLSPSSVFISGQGHHTEALRPVCSITADPVFPLLSPTIITSWIFFFIMLYYNFLYFYFFIYYYSSVLFPVLFFYTSVDVCPFYSRFLIGMDDKFYIMYFFSGINICSLIQ